MLVKVKTVANKVAEIEIEGSATIADLKAKIADALEKPVDTQRLVYKGKILSDDSATLDACEIIETNTVIVTNQVKATAAPTATPAPAKATETGDAPARAAAVAAPVEASPAPPPTAASVEAAVAVAPPTVEISAEIVDTLAAVSGYPRETCELAVRATQGNGELAGALLMEGIPYETLKQLAENPQLLAQMFAGGEHDHDHDEDDSEMEFDDEEALMAAIAAATQGEQVFTLEETHPLAPLERHPQFRQLRAAVAANPALLAQVMELIVSQQPEMAQAISDNQEAFQRLLSGESAAPASTPAAAPSATPAAATHASPASAPAPAPAEGQVTITLTPEENEQVDMLVMMTGVPKGAAIQAFLACGKNAELAANLLFDNGGDF